MKALHVIVWRIRDQFLINFSMEKMYTIFFLSRCYFPSATTFGFKAHCYFLISLQRFRCDALMKFYVRCIHKDNPKKFTIEITRKEVL